MKNFVPLLIFSFLSLTTVYSQEWINDLPQEKLENGSLTFYEIQDAFYDYWEPYDVEKAYYYVDGEKVKAPYYKLFKRWEWYWQSRINPETGEFPDVSALDEYYKNLQENKSLSGNWTSMGPYTSPGGYFGLGRLNCVAFVPGSTNEYYAGAASGGIWYTADDGVTWVNLNDTVPVLGVSDILVINTAVGPDILYIATGDRDGGALWSIGGQQSNDNNSVGILKSIDGGATWNTTGLSFTANQKVRINRLLMDPNSAYQTMYAATTQGLYRTLDGGVSWTLMTSLAFIDMEFHPNAPSTIYASTEGSSTTSIYLSANYGNTWNHIVSYSGIRTELAVSYNQPQWVYAVVAASGGGLQGVYKSTDDGATYSLVYDGSTSNNLMGWDCNGGDTGGQGSYDLCIAVDPNNANIVYTGGVNTWKSTDGGTTFNIVNHWSPGGCGSPSFAQSVHADKHYFAFQNGTSTLFECNDGGLYKTSDGGINWAHLSSGMAISQIYRLGVGQINADEVITGLQDNGTKARLNGIWTDHIGGDGFECIIDYTNDNIQYGTLYYGDIYLTTDYWTSPETLITGSLPGQGAWCTPYIIDPTNNQTLYVGYCDIWKTTNQGTSWSQISNQGSTTNFRSMAIAASNTNYIYAATLGNIFRTTNGGGPTQAWTNINSNLPVSSANITYISVKDDDPNHVWVSLGDYNNHGVYETTNGGTSWTNISAGLPQIPVMCVIQNKQNATAIELYAATDVGVYVKDGGNNWIPFSDGLPNVVVTELDIYYDNVTPNDSKIYAASYGRGVWSSDLYSLYQPPIADFSGSPTSGLPPLDVAFSDLSLNTISSWAWDFGDGNTSSIQHPQHFYNDPGLYSVFLTVTGPGGSDTHTKTDYISVQYAAPTADFVGNPTLGFPPLTVNFTDVSSDSVNTWSWDFGDGNTSLIQNPVHIYQNEGIYNVSLTVSGPGGSDTEIKNDYILVLYPSPTADFIGDPTSGYFPLTVNFTDLSSGVIDSWTWNFGDGGTSMVQSPAHTYQNSGNYTVTLIVSPPAPGYPDTLTKENYITVLVGVKELITESIKVYPNPCSEFLIIRSEKPVSSIKMADLMGNIVKDELIQCPAPCERKINVLELHAGIYFCRITLENGDIVLMKVQKK
jgi:PKD repeat protein